jgi:hypothetical protein
MNKLLDVKDGFVCTLAAPRGSGKSHLIRTMLQSGFMKKFDHVVVMSPSLDLNDDYVDYIGLDKVTLISEISETIIDQLFTDHEACMKQVRHRERFEKELPPITCPYTLLILDDIIDSNLVTFRGVVDKYAERGRHINLSLIVSSQRISAVSRSIRINSNYFIVFSPFSVAEMEQFLEQFVSRDQRSETRHILSDIFKKNYEFVLLDNFEKDPILKLKHSNAKDFVNNKTYDLLSREDVGVKRKREEEDIVERINLKRGYPLYRGTNPQRSMKGVSTLILNWVASNSF